MNLWVDMRIGNTFTCRVHQRLDLCTEGFRELCWFRYKEQERVMATFEKDLHLPVTCVDATEQFLSKLKGVVDPEKKRKIIGAEFIAVFDEFSHRLEREIGKKPAFLVQGTLYPDVIESCPPPGSGKSHSHTIKSHHNVGGLPANMQLKLVEPLKWLFKDEVPSPLCLSLFNVFNFS